MKDSILITGASSDLGVSLIQRLDSKATIFALYHSNNVFKQQCFNDRHIIPLQCDLSNTHQIQAMIAHIQTIDIPNKIVHLASPRICNTHFGKLAWEDYKTHLSISLESIFHILQAFIPQLVRQKDKRDKKVVFMLSSCTMGVPPATLSHYVTAKYALLGLLKSLASEYKSKNIQFNAISPSMIETKFLSNINEKIIELNAYNHPLKRNATIDDVLPALLFLLGRESNYINGENLIISGGEVF
ncbi:SDR family NAD(P)-dependent oxidoreductase [Helicobacter cinaedi]|uniref:SDR family NAD(P)-dependent oxidoreductase n=1 Tax=Helicobacter cinaedi TaxID=213 RepID=UPI000CF11EE9|nr:SDR family oxidoreductase [Helicobacter cinaedi]